MQPVGTSFHLKCRISDWKTCFNNVRLTKFLRAGFVCVHISLHINRSNVLVYNYIEGFRAPTKLIEFSDFHVSVCVCVPIRWKIRSTICKINGPFRFSLHTIHHVMLKCEDEQCDTNKVVIVLLIRVYVKAGKSKFNRCSQIC